MKILSAFHNPSSNFSMSYYSLFPHPPPKIVTVLTSNTTNWFCLLYQFARATLTKNHKLGGLNKRNLLSVLEARNPRSKLSVVLVPSEGCEVQSAQSLSPSFWQSLTFFGLWKHHLNICFHLYMASSQCVCLCVQISFFIKILVILDQGLTLLQYDLI